MKQQTLQSAIKYIKMTWGFANKTRTMILTDKMSQDIWDRSKGLQSHPEYIWIFAEPTEEEIKNRETINEKAIV